MSDSPCTPTLEELRTRTLRGSTVPVAREVLADLDTPVSAYLKIRDGGASFLLESVEGGERLGRYSFIGTSPRKVLRLKNGRCDGSDRQVEECRDPLELCRTIVQSYDPALPGTGRFEGGALGYLSYECGSYFERVPLADQDALGLPDAAFMDVDTVLIFDHVAHTIRVVSHVWLDEGLPEGYARASARIDELIDRLQAPLTAPALGPIVSGPFTSNMSTGEFESMVRTVKDHIVAGDILQAVVSQRLSAPIVSDAFSFYRQLRGVSPSPFMYFMDFADHQVIGASPELLIQVEDRNVVTRPIAGTRPRGRDVEHDASLAEDLMTDDKERAEHLMLVDLARNDVGRVSDPGSVDVSNFMSVERFSHVMHLVSDVRGRLTHDRDGYDALRAAFPAGTVSGAPKIRAMQIIAEVEPDARGPYAGAVGFVNTSGDVEMAITIRTGVVKDGFLHVQVGAGIVADSVPEREYQETLNKARALRLAAGDVRDIAHR